MDWDSIIGPGEKPPEEQSVQVIPPPVLDDVMKEANTRLVELTNQATAFFKESDGFKLPVPSTFCSYKDKGIKLEPELIAGILRRGHKMMVSGASKSGKSFMLIELALCLASGTPWMGYKCRECKVLYVNLEISEPSFAHRIECVADETKTDMKSCDQNLKIINLRGTSVSLNKMSGALIGTILTEEAETGEPYGAIILDPIYKISQGEENSAKDVGDFCHQLDRIAAVTGASVIYSHHHSKGDQGYKSAQDRASGSGVFARDADAMIDMIELEIDKDTYQAMKGKFACDHWIHLLDTQYDGWKDDAQESDLELSGNLAAIYQKKARISDKIIAIMAQNIEAQFQESMKGKVPIRIEFTLREFASPDPVNVFFVHPVHIVDDTGILAAADPKCHIQGQKKEKVKTVKKNKQAAFYETVSSIITEKGFATYSDIKPILRCSDDTIRSRLKDFSDEFEVVVGGGNEKTKIYFRGEVGDD